MLFLFHFVSKIKFGLGRTQECMCKDREACAPFSHNEKLLYFYNEMKKLKQNENFQLYS